MKTTSHPRIWFARQLDISRPLVQLAVTRLRRACASGDAAAALDAIVKAVPDYQASESALKTARLVALRVNAPSTRAGSTDVPGRSDALGRSA